MSPRDLHVSASLELGVQTYLVTWVQGIPADARAPQQALCWPAHLHSTRLSSGPSCSPDVPACHHAWHSAVYSLVRSLGLAFPVSMSFLPVAHHPPEEYHIPPSCHLRALGLLLGYTASKNITFSQDRVGFYPTSRCQEMPIVLAFNMTTA